MASNSPTTVTPTTTTPTTTTTIADPTTNPTATTSTTTTTTTTTTASNDNDGSSLNNPTNDLPTAAEDTSAPSHPSCLQQQQQQQQQKQKQQKQRQPQPVPPPDGGWGWVVVVASFLVSVCVDGVCFSIGIFFDPLRHYFGSSKAQTAWVGSVLNGSYLIVGPVVSAFVNRYGCRKMAMLGSLLAAVFFFVSTFSPNLPVLILTYGVLGGMCFGFLYLPAIVMVGYYFEKRRALATGIACSGSGIGGFVFAPLCNFLLELYGWKGATWILSGLVLNAVVLSTFYRPLTDNQKPKPDVTQNGECHSEESARLLSGTAEEDEAREDGATPYNRNGDVISTSASVSVQLRKSQDSGLPSIDSECNTPKIKRKESTPQHEAEVSNPRENTSDAPPETFLLPDIVVETVDADIERKTETGDESSGLENQNGTDITEATLSNFIQTITPKGSAAQSKTFLSAGNLTDPQENPIARMAFSHDALGTASRKRRPHERRHHEQQHHHQHHQHHHLDVDNPLKRRDIFYSGSLRHIPEYRSSETLAEYRRKVTKFDDEDRRESRARGQDVEKGKEEEENEEEDEEEEEEKAGGRKGKTLLEMFRRMFDFSLLRSPTFLIYGTSCTLCMAGFFVPFMYLPTLATDLGMERTQGALLVAIIGAASTGGRVAAGFVSDQDWADCLLINNVALMAGGAATFCVPFLRHFAVFAVYAVVFGTAIAVFVSLRSIIMVELMGLQKLTDAFGLVVMCQGISSFIGTPFAGFLSDVTGNYNSSFFVAGLFLAMAGAICLPLRRIARWEQNKQKRTGAEIEKNA